jgi:hypothetical protein
MSQKPASIHYGPKDSKTRTSDDFSFRFSLNKPNLKNAIHVRVTTSYVEGLQRRV